MQRVLILGVDGLLGSALRRRISIQEGLELFTTARHLSADYYFDYTPKALSKLLFEVQPDVVINCIAISSRRAKFKRILLVNSMLPIQLAMQKFRFKYRVIHFSTNAVFSGKSNRNTERTFTIPATSYGISKLIGDLSFFQNTVIRTSFVGVSPNASVKSGLIEKLRAIEPHGCVSIVDNHTWNGITCDALVELVLGIILENELIPGIFHLGTLSSISREQLFHNILDSLGRTDVRVNVVHQNPVRNLSLDSRKKAIVASWWAKTKYLETPELEDLWRDMKLN